MSKELKQAAARALGDCDCLDAALRDGERLDEARELLHRLIDTSNATQLRGFLVVVQAGVEMVLKS